MNKERIEGVSFVIPAKNEESHIIDTLQAINRNMNCINFETIVIDNDSTDKTAQLAQNNGALVIHKSGGTIGSARNMGVNTAKYDIIIFIDADVSLTTQWSENISNVLDRIRSNYKYMTGSHCSPPPDGNWIERYWFQNFSQKANTVHLGTGHLIISSRLFEEINGFDETLRTGEDYDICQRAKHAGAELVNNEKLFVIHRDYPKNIVKFIIREMWHGAGDCQNLRRFLSSKVALIATLVMIFHLIATVGIFTEHTHILIGSVFGIISLCIISSAYKFHAAGIKVVLVNSTIFYFYYLGRFLSIWKKK